MAMFTGFKPQGMQKIANRLGYSGDMMNFDSYLEQNPDKKRKMIVFEDAARKMAEGGSVVRMANGGSATERDKLQSIIYDSGASEYEKSQARNSLNALNNPPPVGNLGINLPTKNLSATASILACGNDARKAAPSLTSILLPLAISSFCASL